MPDLLTVAAMVLPASVVAFMVCNLAAIGLELEIGKALAPLANLRFVLVVMVLDWLLGPAFAWALSKAMPMAEPYALGAATWPCWRRFSPRPPILAPPS